jgi:hypothetical protein
MSVFAVFVAILDTVRQALVYAQLQEVWCPLHQPQESMGVHCKGKIIYTEVGVVLHAIMDIVLPQLAVQAELSFSMRISVGDERNRPESLPADDSSRYLAFEVPQLRMKYNYTSYAIRLPVKHVFYAASVHAS